MVRGEIIIDEVYCHGCEYCVKFCSRGCIELSQDKFTREGYLLPVFVQPDRCNGCGVCAWMCPGLAIEVYKFEAQTA